MKKPAQHLIAEVPRRHARTELTVGIDLGDVWSHYCTLNQHGEVVDRGRFRTTAKGIEALADVMVAKGVPEHLRSDNGPEFVARDLRKWLAGTGARTAYIEPEAHGKTATARASTRSCGMSF